ncbi:aldo/keto reductase [Pyxidicoccus parkwayensis]|uniref:Aldo/keto reductase n=1 Tax=Pyxidicoccus parkwayensis TaxID=2813578 RepID=A0ABX7NPS1_9BACT|nr:aldo/keto reductase [Pyxidicoccus parkwaysis]QSQ20846.1 aldo/keto reductase [Pyxidicoccus parkwaysis]
MTRAGSTAWTGKLGQSTVPRVGLGCMGMSEFYGASDEAENLRILAKAFEVGYAHFDTADMYGNGHNEQLLGRFLKTVPREKVFLASKFGIVRDGPGGLSRSVNNRPEYVREACDRSLARLGVDYLDLYYVHRRDASVPIEETVGAMAELVKAGKVRALGLSEVSVETLRRGHKVHPIAAIETEYSLLSRDPDAELLPACKELGVAFVAYSPLSRGLLTAELKPDDVKKNGDVRQFLPRFSGDNFNRNLALVEKLKEIAGERKCTPSQLALAWVLSRGEHIHIIPGTRREKYLIENFGAGSIQLSASEVDRITSAIDVSQVVGTRYPEAAMQGIGR